MAKRAENKFIIIIIMVDDQFRGTVSLCNCPHLLTSKYVTKKDVESQQERKSCIVFPVLLWSIFPQVMHAKQLQSWFPIDSYLEILIH